MTGRRQWLFLRLHVGIHLVLFATHYFNVGERDE
jgi:hypothetical protein